MVKMKNLHIFGILYAYIFIINLMKKVLYFFLTPLVSLIIIALLVGGYLGVVPGLASLFGANKPKDLGVTCTQADLTQAMATTGVTYTKLVPRAGGYPKETIKYSGTKAADFSLTQEQVTSLINNQQWIYYPVKSAQIKFNQDNTIEFSANLVTANVGPYAEAMRGTRADADRVTKWLKGDPAIYLKGSAAMINNKLTVFDVQKIQIGRLSISSSIVNSQKSEAMAFIEGIINNIAGLHVATAKIENGKFMFTGNMYTQKATASTTASLDK